MNSRRRLEPLKGLEDDSSFNGNISTTSDPKDKQKVSYLGEYEQKRLSIERPHLNSSKPSKLPNTIAESSNEATTKPRPDSRHSHNAPPPAELRGQLPWSYFKSRDDVSGPRKTFTQLREDEDVPPVPVPDYTLHFPKKDRPRTSSVTTDDGSELTKF